MGTVFNKKELLVLLQDFHCLTGLRSAVFDSYGIEVLAYPPELPAYCRLIRSVPDGKTGCYLCDQAACRKATRQKQTIIYPCHSGLIEVITPVQISRASGTMRKNAARLTQLIKRHCKKPIMPCSARPIRC